MALLAYLDESGDHELKNIDPSFPNFCLALALFERDEYVTKVIPDVAKLKIKHFGHEGVVLHSRDIRKASGDFQVLRSGTRRSSFMSDLEVVMGSSSYELIAIVVKKPKHARRYVWAANPYELSMKFALERLLEWASLARETEVTVIAESRGKREDAQLAASFQNVISTGTEYVSPTQFSTVHMRLLFTTKERNCAGHQIADLAAYACARQFDPARGPYRSFGVIQPKLFRGKRHVGGIYGLKLFP